MPDGIAPETGATSKTGATSNVTPEAVTYDGVTPEAVTYDRGQRRAAWHR